MKPFSARLCAAFVLVAGLLAFSSPAVPVHADAGESLAAGRAVAGSLSGGSYHTCLAKNGNAYCWGFNNNFQIGDGTTTSRNTPQMVSGLSSPISVAAGGTQSCAVQSDGLLLCWGNQAGYSLLDGSANPNPIGAPSKIQNASGPLTNVRYVDLGGESYGKDNGCAITTAGALWCWGANLRGQVGDGTQINRTRAVLINITNVVAVSVGINHSCAVLQDGGVKCWGQNDVGQLGDSLPIDSTSFSTSP
jgi:alpha-tubulin suppressor-like RCC1 family protein